MIQNTFFPRRFQRTLMPVLAASVILSQPVCGSAQAGSDVSDFENHVLTRVDQTTENGIVRSHLVDSKGNIYTDKNAGKTSSGDDKRLKKAANLPSAYDLRDYNLTTSIKDQGVTGCCWAFSAVKAIESNGIKLGLFSPDTADLSESHLTWFSYHPASDSSDPLYGDGIVVPGRNPFGSSASLTDKGVSASTFPYDNGGSATLATFSLANWSGPEMEAAAPFSGLDQASLNSMAESMASNGGLRYNSYAHMQNAISFDEYLVGEKYYYRDKSIISDMKQSILDNGAMSVAFYFAKKHVNTASPGGTAYYQTEYTGANAVEAGNHAVTIIGWDDNYSRKNFAVSPPEDGAWLIANSYGTEFGDAGCFWLSYYDPSISDCFTFQMEPTNNYGKIYQYDGFGWGNANYSDSYSIKAANIFTADSTSPQQLRAVSFYTLTDNQPYKIEIYRGVSSSPTNGTRIAECTTSDVMERVGYHTVPLASPVNIAAGERFSVVVTYIQSGSSYVYAPYEGRDAITPSLSIQYHSKKKQSFLFTKVRGTSSRGWYDLSSMGYNNVCIKAFANNTDSAEPAPEVTKKITLGKGEKFQLGGSSRTYKSNDTALLSVSGKGKITAKNRGVSTITVSTDESDSLVQVTVKKAPSSIKIKPSGRKKLKKGKTLQLKKGKTLRLKTSLSSGSASHKITYRSSKKRVASVTSSGKVTARKAGKTVITARTYNGKKARLTITVTRA